MSQEPKYDPQAREFPDPHEKARPIPMLLLVVVTAALIWAISYILLNQRNDAPELGDQRTIATLQAKSKDTVGNVDGAQLYAAQCLACHQASGAGLAGVFPPLAGAEWVVGSERVLVNIVLHGVSGTLTVKGATYSGQMPAFKEKLSDAEIAAVLTHVRSSFGNTASAVEAEVVTAERSAGKDRDKPWNGDEDLKKIAQ